MDPRKMRAAGATLAAGLVAGAFEGAHSLAYTGRLAWASIAYGFALVVVETAVLSVTYAATERRRWPGALSFLLCGAIAIAVGVAASFARYGTARPGIVAQLGAFGGLFAVGLWALAILGPRLAHEANARAIEARQLRTAAELVRLRAHLQPHFLLNTLTTIAGLVSEDPREARNLLGALGDLLRDSLDGEETQTLDSEVAWLRRYAEILESRHRGSIRFEWEIAPDTRAVRVPRLLLQPLVENAVKHGALRRRDGGEVAVRTRLDAGTLRCVVEDNGPGPIATERAGLGIDLVERRLALEYAGSATFRLETRDGRTRSIVDLPARTS